jgi:hypothetical protein
MRTVEVKMVVPRPSYDSAAEAIRADVRSPRCAQSRIDSDRIAGASVEAHRTKDDGLWLNLSNGRYLAITVGGNGLPTWK